MSARDDYRGRTYGLWDQVVHVRTEDYEAAMDEIDALRRKVERPSADCDIAGTRCRTHHCHSSACIALADRGRTMGDIDPNEPLPERFFQARQRITPLSAE